MWLVATILDSGDLGPVGLRVVVSDLGPDYLHGRKGGWEYEEGCVGCVPRSVWSSWPLLYSTLGGLEAQPGWAYPSLGCSGLP